MATPAASSEAALIRFPDDRRAMDVSISRLTLKADAAACRAALLVAIDNDTGLTPYLINHLSGCNSPLLSVATIANNDTNRSWVSNPCDKDTITFSKGKNKYQVRL